MAIAFDTRTAGGFASSVSSINWSHTLSTAGNPFLVVFTFNSESGLITASSVLCGATNLTKLDSWSALVSGTGLTEAFEVWVTNGTPPPTGAQTITVNWSGSGAGGGIALSYTGAHQTTPIINGDIDKDERLMAGGKDPDQPSITINVVSVEVEEVFRRVRGGESAKIIDQSPQSVTNQGLRRPEEELPGGG